MMIEPVECYTLTTIPFLIYFLCFSGWELLLLQLFLIKFTVELLPAQVGSLWARVVPPCDERGQVGRIPRMNFRIPDSFGGSSSMSVMFVVET